MATIDQPTPPNLGNLSPGAFLALPDWSVVAQNQTGPDGGPLPDTFEAMQLCVVALLYRVIRDNFAYENDAWACRVSTPLLEKIEALETKLQSRATDNLGQALTLSLLSSFAAESPSYLFSLDGTVNDQVSGGDAFLIPTTIGTPAVYHVVNAKGSQGLGGDVVYGVSPTKNRYYYTDARRSEYAEPNVIASCNVTPQWPQDSSVGSKIILLKVADYLTTDETGATKRMQFEFGLQATDVGFDPLSHGTDMVMYLRYFNSQDEEQIAFAFNGGSAVGIGFGREITLGFTRLENGGDYDVGFYVNGTRITLATELDDPSTGSSSDIRLHAGSNQLGDNVVGGPINNVYYTGTATTKTQAEADALMNTVYRIGAGYLTV